MNVDRTILELNLRLLIMQHGKTRVSEALSAIEEVDLTEIHKEVKACEGRRGQRKTKPRSRRSVEEMIQAANPGSDEAEGVIRRLAFAYENKEFLPELRDVRHFVESRSVSPPKFRSRADGLSTIIGILAQCGLDELNSLDKRRKFKGGDLGIITDQILGQTMSR